MDEQTRRKALTVFFIIVALAAFANGMSESTLSSYFKETYDVTAVQRGFIEIPRETPGVLCAIIVAALSSLGDIRIAFIAHILAAVNLAVMGLFTPTFGVMLIFLFFSSVGFHLNLPLQDAIGLSLCEQSQVGRRMGQFASTKSIFSFIAAGLVLVGFRVGFFDFKRDIKLNFVVAAISYTLAAIMMLYLLKLVAPKKAPKKKFQLIFRKQYKFYYMLTILGGVQKQIIIVFGTWVVLDILGKGADTMAMLYIAANFISIFFMRALGKWLDKFGIKLMLFADAFSFVGVYLLYGFAVLWITTGDVPVEIATAVIYALFIADRLSMNMGMIKSVYLRSIVWNPKEVSATLSTGITLDHIVTIFAGMAGGFIWEYWGSHWVFFMAAAFSLGNVVIAVLVQPQREKELAIEMREKLAAEV